MACEWVRQQCPAAVALENVCRQSAIISGDKQCRQGAQNFFLLAPHRHAWEEDDGPANDTAINFTSMFSVPFQIYFYIEFIFTLHTNFVFSSLLMPFLFLSPL